MKSFENVKKFNRELVKLATNVLHLGMLARETGDECHVPTTLTPVFREVTRVDASSTLSLYSKKTTPVFFYLLTTLVIGADSID